MAYPYIFFKPLQTKISNRNRSLHNLYQLPLTHLLQDGIQFHGFSWVKRSVEFLIGSLTEFEIRKTSRLHFKAFVYSSWVRWCSDLSCSR